MLPLSFPLGLALFVAALALVVLPLGFAVILFVGGSWALAFVVLVLWGAAMYLLRGLYRRLLEGSGGL